jgi:putative endonuclease
MKKKSSQIGWEAEEKAAAFLRERGYRLCERNYRSREGEIDLVAVKEGRTEAEDHLAFVEVKFRTSDRWGRPMEAVTYAKQQKLMKTAVRYLAEHPWQGTLSFDIIEVIGGTMEAIEHYPNAFCPWGPGGG